MAAVDVYESEPVLDAASAASMDNVVCTPHIGYADGPRIEIAASVPVGIGPPSGVPVRRPPDLPASHMWSVGSGRSRD